MATRRSEATISAAEVVKEYLDPAYQYDFWQNPDRVRSRDVARRDGLNCVSLAHLVLKDMFEYELPAHLGCAELYLDQEHFEPVSGVQDMRSGDLAWFGLKHAARRPEEITLRYDEDGNLINWRDFPVKHVAISTGEFAHGDDPLLLHATHREGRLNRVWPLSKFSDHERYQKLYAVTRLVLPQVVAPLA